MLTASAWYSGASSELIDATISQLEAGNQERVIDSLKELHKEFRPSYESSNYDELVEKAVQQMTRAEEPRWEAHDQP
ncbi:hypothetical protein [Pseudobythopirellula maris]|nr:hypothetical protein [Pseudobythopirellula maris]